MNDDESLKIVLTIGGEKFELFVQRQQEGMYREAARLINRKYQNYLNEFPAQSKETYLTMTLIDIAVALQEEREVDDRLEQLVAKIDKVSGGH